MGPVSRLLSERVALRLSCLDRILVGGYVPRLQSEGMVVRWMLDRGEQPSPRVFGRARERAADAVDRFVKATGAPLLTFERHQSKEDLPPSLPGRGGARRTRGRGVGGGGPGEDGRCLASHTRRG